jgi:hypothetical protein
MKRTNLGQDAGAERGPSIPSAITPEIVQDAESRGAFVMPAALKEKPAVSGWVIVGLLALLIFLGDDFKFSFEKED